MSISKIASKIGDSATLSLNAKAAKMRSEGKPVIHLGGGEPKTKAPLDAILAAANLLNSGEVRYVPCAGTADMKAAVIRYTEAFYGYTPKPENVIASSGAKQAIMVCLQAVLDPGNELLYPVPYWVSYPDMTRLCGAEPKPITSASGSLLPSIEDFERQVTDKSKAVLINSPNNPSGVMYPREFIRDIVKFCEDRDLYLIMDDIYHRLVFDGHKPISAFEFATKTGADSKLVVVNGVSKQYAMTGFRIGWAVGNPELIAVMSKIQTHQTSGPSVLLQKAAAAAINGPQSSVERTCA
ncbi:MAG: aminotransferase class I/II-fold pyridoxal phosphate-dependent enzyme [bacterium]